MASNHKLTALLRGRAIGATSNLNDKLIIGFTDGSQMSVKTAGSVNAAITGGTVKAVRQAGTELNLDFDDGDSRNTGRRES